MSNGDLKERIQSTLTSVPNKNFLSVTKDLLNVLGYQSERTLELSGHPEDFIQQFPAPNENTKTEQTFCENVQSVQLVFQLASHEIASTGLGTNAFDEGLQQSFIFFAVVLKETNYVRGQYAEFTREINKRINVPTVVFYRAGNMMTIAFVGRRPHKRNKTRDVLEHVTLIKDIRPHNPYRAHLDILAELSLRNLLLWMETNNQPKNFDSLLAAWLDKLDTEELNRRFYRDLYSWFERAVEEASFPKNQAQTISSEEHVIRLITRLLFVWFIKEKGLIAEDLFIENKVGDLLKNYDPDTGDSYYRAVLQNLFFATLNTEIDKRRFSKQNRADHRNPSVYRYREEIDDPDSLLKLFDQTPFINGGLFDCLDSFEGVQAGGTRIDCFTDNPAQRRDYSIPNRLFFGIDGLITLFNNYKFTVEENTPIEQEVALDPELLGKVFENLLAAYNPETHDTARKQTGSFYTPRDVVDYLVNEALMVILAEKSQPIDGDMASWQERLRYLLDYEDAFDGANELFEEEAEGIVRAIAEIKVLDPAVGSGAFPMGMLHKLTLALRRLDPDNTRWEALQKERARAKANVAFETRDQRERDAELLEISETFERYSGDFGRKLYLIQNSIFGVDTLPVACQIAKLRFFISLAIEQEPDETAENFGIKPLPNLETRFIAADTLMSLEGEWLLTSKKAQDLERELYDNRERYFHATTRQQKFAYKEKDKELREELATELKSLGFPADAGEKIAHWESYDQNANADWFDTKYMFGLTEGFDVVIGNPPYVQLQKHRGELRRRYQDANFETFTSTGDIYQLFYEKGCQLLAPECGVLSYITSNSWLRANYGKSLRRYFSERHTPLKLLEMGKDVFENAIVDTSILVLRHGKGKEICKAVDMDRLPSKHFPPDDNLWVQMRPQGESPWSILPPIEQSIKDKMEAIGTPLKEWNISFNYGIKTGLNDAFIIDDTTKQALVAKDPNSADIIRPVLRGRDIQQYQVQWANLYLIDTHNGYSDVPAVSIADYPAIKNYLDEFYSQLEKRRDKGKTPYNLRNCAYHEEFEREKLIWMDLTEQGRFAYDSGGMFCSNTAFIMSGEHLKYLCAILNSKLITWFMKNTALNSGMGVPRWIRATVETIPIPKISTTTHKALIRVADKPLSFNDIGPRVNNDKHDLIATIVNYIIYLKKQPSTDGKNLAHARDYIMVKYFEQIIDGLVYELYLTDELHRADKYFFKPLLDEHLPPIKEISGDKMPVLRSIFERLFDRKHPVRKNLFFLDSLETIRIIEGKT